MSTQELRGQVAVVTGGAQGIGFAIAKLLVERGASVCLLDLDEGRLAGAVEELGGAPQALGIVADVADERALVKAREQILSRHGKVEILVNNAGAYPPTTIANISVEDWNWSFDVNAKSIFLATRCFMGTMVERRYGRIVSIISVDAYNPKPTNAHYAAAKAAGASLVKTFALDLAPHQVLVNGVSPGAVATERAKGQSWLKERIKEIPLGRAAEPEDIAEVVLFLASLRNRFMTGETVIASGGAVML